MNRLFVRLPTLLLTLALVACSAAQESSYTLEPVAEGLSQSLGLTTDGVNENRLYIVEQGGRVRVIEDGALVEAPFLDISGQISAGGERGLLDIAFHPNYAENRLVFVHYSDPQGNTVLSSFQASGDGTQLLPASETVLLTVQQPFANHNGGELEFGPDGYLYMALGDGGSGGDPQSNGQNPGTLLGTLLRLDVSADGYTVPDDNPFVDEEGARPEVWAYGLRNPWRFSFDRETGDLWIADVGQNQWEEIDLQRSDSGGGENYGWNIMEGAHCYNAATCDRTGLTLPVLEYDHGEGNSVTGGYVYRGSALPDLVGSYVFGDFGSGKVWRAVQSEDGSWRKEELLNAGRNISSFGEDMTGELYLVSIGGSVQKLVGE